MIQIYPAGSRYRAYHGWLESYFSFSFAEYYDPDNMRFGPMRVLNDDVIQPKEGFGMHPHREMEIVTLMLKGQLLHRDSIGNMGILRPGEIQRMSAGTGIIHSEMNASETEEVHLLQMWFEPNERHLQPSYEQIAYDPARMKNQLLPVVSNRRLEQTAYIHQDMTLYLSELEANTSVTFEQSEGRRVFLFVMEGDLLLNQEHRLQRRDSARITDVPTLSMTTETGAFFMLIDLP
jgi:redox-sensitive bicupin YhaK (pirin superfamily)